MHRQLQPPDGLECIVGIVEADGSIHARCIGPDGNDLEGR
jgi:hypothetical protein